MIENNMVACAALWVVFGYQHSLLARPSTKLLVKKFFGCKFEAHFYPLIYFISQCIIFHAIYDTIRHLQPTFVFYELPQNWSYFVFWFNQAANLFLIITVFHFDIGRFTGIKQFIQYFWHNQKNMRDNIQPELNSSYLYRYIRHPMYLGILLVFISSTTIYTDLFLINLISILAYIEIGSYFEEKSLISQYGFRYLEYQRVTKRYLPGVR